MKPIKFGWNILKRAKKAAKKVVKSAKKVARAVAITSAKAALKGISKVIPGSNHIENDLALQISSIANVIEAGRQGKKRTYSRTIEESVTALTGISVAVGYAVSSQKHVGLTVSISLNGAYGYGALVINKNSYYDINKLNDLKGSERSLGENISNDGASLEVDYSELFDHETNEIKARGIGFGYGAGVGFKYWKALAGGNAGVNNTQVYRLW